jgi:hypothetical protein
LAKDPKESPLKVVIATVALGMGADMRHVAQVIHVGPPQNLEGKYANCQITRKGETRKNPIKNHCLFFFLNG